MTPKYNFVKKLQAYFNVEYNDFTIKRIERLLNEYTDELEVIRIQTEEKMEKIRLQKEERLLRKKERKLENKKIMEKI